MASFDPAGLRAATSAAGGGGPMDAATFARYEKMLRIGQPLPLVNKMIERDGHDPKAFAALREEKVSEEQSKWASAASEPDEAFPAVKPKVTLDGMAELKLKPTTTIVRPHPLVGETASFGQQMLNDGDDKNSEEVDEEEATTRRLGHEIAELIRAAKHVVVFTGAGVSTSAGVSDFRGANGVWTMLAKNVIPDDAFDITAVVPSYTHMALVALVNAGHVKSVISTNHDALHMKSGLTRLENLAELHGNVYVERCMRCKREYQRPFPVLRTTDRYTGRDCQCGGGLMDSGIDFGQCLPLAHLTFAEREAAAADVAIVLGSSMRVAPASRLPSTNPACALVICNKMETQFDEAASVRSFAAIDDLMHVVVNALGDVTVAEPPTPAQTGLSTITEMIRRKFQLRELRVAHREAHGEPEEDPNLPPGWSRWEDEETNNATYFFHSPTNRISWGRVTLSDEHEEEA